MSGKDKRSNKKRKDVSSIKILRIILKGKTQDMKKGLFLVYIEALFVVTIILADISSKLNLLSISQQYCAA